jgi:putative DNA primase/helicase
MKHDGELDLAVGKSAKSKIWKNKKMSWSELVQTLSEGHKTKETYKEYISSTKEEQTHIKDVGGYVGGYLRNGKRSPQNVLHRQVVTLDIDFAHVDFWEDFGLLFDNAAVLHATHKHHETSPRFRLVLPLSREASPDEYVAVSRKIAGLLNIDLFDNTTFETNRLMFWPSVPRDIEYYFRFQDGPFVDVDNILASYVDWTDSSAWPTAERQIDGVRTAAEKQEDPENKKGIVGAFCRTYGIAETIEKHLDGVYIEAGEDRYTYTKGTTAGGLIVYEDKYAYSHHGTDPCGGKLCNSFDLLRIHKFGHLDTENEHGRAAKSYKAMEEFSREDKEVKKIIASENRADIAYDFAEVEDENFSEDIDWMQELDVDGKSKYLSTAHNINLIFANDVRLKGLFKQNEFDGKRYIFGNLPWRKVSTPEPIKDVDLSGVRNYIETIYGIAGTLKIDDVLALEFEKNSFHPVLNYLHGLKWDGVQRADEILIKYFGAIDTLYTREAMRKMLVGSVARVYKPGCKFDLVLTLVSQLQGTGKSSFFKALGREWFSDTFMSVQGKEALEQIQGAWIIEMAELSGIRKADVEAVKHFISKQEDMFRRAYGRVTETYKRQCVFVATTNQSGFLKDSSGNRRFLPVDIHAVKLSDNPDLKSLLEDKNEIGQIWAEAVHLFKKGEPLYLSKEADLEAETEQKKHSETDEREGLVEDYLNRPLPKNWDSLDLDQRRTLLMDSLSPKGVHERQYVCGLEVWCECLNRNKEDADRYKTREINEILRGLDEWEFSSSTRNFPLYGKQKYYTRKNDLN